MAKELHGAQQEHTLVLLQPYASLFQQGQHLLQILEVLLISHQNVVKVDCYMRAPLQNSFDHPLENGQ